jgi:iron(III) transport system ATP-binding protein
MTNNAPIVELKDVAKTFCDSPRPVVGPISLAVREGEMMVIVGPSGCGKTTLLRLIAGLERPDAGSIVLHGRTVTDARVWVAPEDRNIGMVFQDFSLFPHLTVEQNVSFGLNPFSDAETRYAADLVRQLGVSDLLARYPHQLSGGEQQRVAVARALAQRPAVVLFDEPFSNLDAGLRPRMRRELKRNLRELGTTGLFVTHDRSEALEIADRVAVLRDGVLEQLDSPEGVYHSPATAFVAEFVSDAEFLSGRIKDGALETELGLHALPASAAGAPKREEGASVDVMVRPEDIELQPIEPGTAETACARVVLRQFRGAEVVCTVRLSSGRELHAEQPVAFSFAEGAPVKVGLKSLPALFYRGKRIG